MDRIWSPLRALMAGLANVAQVMWLKSLSGLTDQASLA
jgi:hypothetical protein